MIRKLTEDDRDAVLNFLYEEPEVNIYLIGDVKNIGFDQEEHPIYGEFKDNDYYAVMSRNHSHITYYAQSKNFNTEWLEIFKQFDYLFISGKDVLIKEIHKHLPELRPDCLEFMKSTEFKRDGSIDAKNIETLKTKEDAKMVYRLLNQIDELDSVRKKTEEEFIEYLLENSDDNGTTVFIRENDEVIASASAVFETRKSAMIVGVATHPKHRKKGLGLKILYYLVDLYVNRKNKTLCLYYDDPRAGHLYTKLGFIKVGDWIMLIKDHE